MKFYLLKNQEAPWGDYGNALCYGYLNMMDEDYNDIDVPELERTGPYIPDLYIANSRDILITDSIKDIFLSCDLKGIKNYVKTKKKQIVTIEWKEWSFDEGPKFLPKSGEPEDYIWEGKHDEELARKMPEVFYVEIEEKHTLKEIKEQQNNKEYGHLALEKESNLDIFIPTNMLYIVVSERFKSVVEKAQIDSVVFIELQKL